MDIIQAVVLGIVEGLTEFLPISSTGHQIIAEKYMNFHDTAKVFTIVIQLGAVLAVIWYYRHDLMDKLRKLFGWQPQTVRFVRNLIVAAIPAGILGLALDNQFEKYSTPTVVAIALIVGAAVLWWADRLDKQRVGQPEHNDLDNVTLRQAVVAGLWQCLALIPGASRSGATIVGGLVGGMNRLTATTFSFYLGIPVLGGAGLYKLAKHHSEFSTVSGGGKSVIIGLVVTFFVALAVISWLLKYVSTHSFRIFVYWRIVLGVLVLVLLR